MQAEDVDGNDLAPMRSGLDYPPAQRVDVDSIVANPSLLNGLTVADVRSRLVAGPAWREESLRRGSHAGEGWVLREYEADGTPTGRVIRWHPGGGHHGPVPYWRVSSPERGKSAEIR